MDFKTCLSCLSGSKNKSIIEFLKKEGLTELGCFSAALILLKNGLAVSRHGWDEGMFVFIDPEHTTNGYRNFTGSKTVKVNSSLCIKNTDKSISHWNPSTDDLLSEDWFLITE